MARFREELKRSRLFLFAAVVPLWAAVFFPRAAGAEELLNWKDCILEARKNHPDLVSAREKINQSSASKSITVSGFLPQVTGGLSGQTTRSSSAVARTDSYSYSLGGRQLLFDGFKTYFDVEAAAKNVDASRYNYDVTSSDVRLRLRTAFIDLLKAQELLNITQDIANRRKQSRDMVKLRYDAGSEHRGSLLTAEANLAQAEFEVEQAKRNVDLAERRLSKELGRTKGVPIKANGDFSVADKDRTKPDFERLSESTPLLRELVVEKEAARWGVKSSVASLFPAVYANASTEHSSSDWPPRGREWTAGASLSVPLFEGGSLMAGISKAEAEYHQAQADEKSGRDGVILTLEDAWTQFQDALGQVEVGRKFLEAGRERTKIAEAQYSSGLITFNDWVIIEDNLVSAQKSFLSDEAGALQTEAAWAQAKGETLDAD
jgi:outer membrane protein TolC